MGYSPWGHKELDMTEHTHTQTVLLLWGFPGGSAVKNSPTMQETQEMQLPSLGQEDPQEEEMATHSSNLACKFPWTDEPHGLQSMG